MFIKQRKVHNQQNMAQNPIPPKDRLIRDVSESSRNVIVVTASVKEDERGG
jgi:hypothetical protein